MWRRTPHHLTAPCQQSRLCAEAHRGIVVKAPGVTQNNYRGDKMYNSMIFGNGMTLYTMAKIRQSTEILYKEYLDCNNFINSLIQSKIHQKIRRDYYKLFDENNPQNIKYRDLSFVRFKEDFDLISKLGFERWVSAKMFEKGKEPSVYDKLASYLIYNYWFSVADNIISNSNTAHRIIDKTATSFLSKLTSDDRIFTTNFDSLYDDVLNPQHLHGRFQLPLKKFRDVRYKSLSSTEFEYKFLLGSNGLEKSTRINRIIDFNEKIYELDFFVDDSIFYGYLLIFGLAFGRTKFMTDEFLEEYPQHKTNRLVLSVDGHIIFRLEKLLELGRLEKITLSYYSKSDLDNYKFILNESPLLKIIQFIHCDEIIG